MADVKPVPKDRKVVLEDLARYLDMNVGIYFNNLQDYSNVTLGSFLALSITSFLPNPIRDFITNYTEQ